MPGLERFHMLQSKEAHVPQLLKPMHSGNGNPFQYSCLENPVDGGAWWAAVHGTTKSRSRLKWLSMHACIGEGNATHSSLLAWRIPGMGEPGGLLPMGSHRVGHDWSGLAAACALGPKSLSNGSSWAYSLRFTTGKATAVRSPCTTRDTSLQLLQLEKAWVQQQRPSTTTQKLIKKQ